MGGRTLMTKLLHGHRAGIRLTGLLIACLCCAPLAVFAATPTPTVGVGQPGQAQVGTPPGTRTGQFPPGFSPGGVPGSQGAQPPTGPVGARVGPTNPQQTMYLAVSLKVQDQHALDTFLHDLYDPTSPQFHHYLSPADFTKRFITSSRQPVVDFLKNAKLSVTDRGSGSIINATGTVDQVQTALKVNISDYQDGSGSVSAAADVAPTLPSSISPYIQAIVGLDNIIQVKTHMDPAPAPDAGNAPAAPTTGASGCDAALTVASTFGAYTPNQLKTAYNFTPFTQRGEQGEGQIIGLMEVDDYKDVNVAAYQSCFGTNVPVTRVPVDGGTRPGPFEEEVELDIDVYLGMLPKLQQMLVYESDIRITAIIDSLQLMANDNLASVVSISFGGCEQNRNPNTFLMPENTIFEQMAAQGQSVFAASGDSGSRDCAMHHTATANALAVDDPASQPYVTGVGGTKLTVDPTTGAYTGETVWNAFGTGGGAGGGGLSTVWPMQDYQTGSGVANAYSNGKRQVPDVAANADPKSGFIIYTTDPQNCARVTGSIAGSCFMATGGTSVAAPMWAAAATLTNQHLLTAGYPRMGFANPVIYRLFNSNPAVFHDITAGHNCFDASCDGASDARYPATPGYDLATGVGTFDAFAFSDAVLNSLPHFTGTNPTTGPVAGGTTVTFTGANFQGATTVSIGGVPATNVQVPDSKTITAVAPPHAVGAVDIEIVTGAIHFTLPKAYTYATQAPSPLTPATPTPPAASSTPTSTPAPTTPTPTTRKFVVTNTDGDSVN
ncbi:MAG: protease pro-enzyme activation domain-containing protein, partial [Chloroflexota bacterium]|nr:protease pro-enzyme activation domain-containing protein [Chloroflexota bacterium]